MLLSKITLGGFAPLRMLCYRSYKVMQLAKQNAKKVVSCSTIYKQNENNAPLEIQSAKIEGCCLDLINFSFF